MSHIANSNIRVDNFQYRQQDKTSYCYFLSHCHEDHLKGLSNKWSQGKIYCSYLSKNLIVNRFPGLKNWVIDLEMDEEHWIYIDEEKKEGVQVVLIDACHCPGAVMFLFRGKMGTVLHTGDFRFSETMLKNEWLCPKEKRNTFMKAITVDVDYLHLDNTFANPEYDFPSREEAYLSLVKIVKSHIDHRIFLFSYSLGKEEVLLLLAEEFKCKIVVDEERMAKVKLLELSQEVFTTDQNASKIHIKQIRELPKYDINQCNKEMPTIFIILTGWNDKYNKNLPFYFKVPYSSHSNYRELERFVKAINPRKIIFNVHERNDTKKRHEFQTYLAREYERKGPLVPTTSATPLSRPPQLQMHMGLISTKMMAPVKSLLHPIANQSKMLQQPVGQIGAGPIEQVNVNVGYKNAVQEMSSRFDINNKELNKRRFNEQYSHILNASKARGAKFTKQEVSLSLTPPFADQNQQSLPKQTDLQMLMNSDSDSRSQRFESQAKGEKQDLLLLDESSDNSKSYTGRNNNDQPEVINLCSSSCSSSGCEIKHLSQSSSKKRKFTDAFPKMKPVEKVILKRRKLDSESQESNPDLLNRVQLLALKQAEASKRKKPSKKVEKTKDSVKAVALAPSVAPAVVSQVDQAYIQALREQYRRHQASILEQAKSVTKTN